MVVTRCTVAAVLLQLAAQAVAHGDDEHCDGDMCGMMKPEAHNEGGEPDYYAMPSYAGLGTHGTMMLAHIGVMFSVAGSRYALPAQFLFLVLNGFGVLFGTI